jgi:Fe-S oxidoreductase
MIRALTLAMLAVALATFARAAWLRLAPLRALRREVRTDRLRERLSVLVRYGLGQRRLVDPEERTAGLLHVLVFAAFLVLALRTLTLFGVALGGEGFHLPLLGPDAPLGVAYRLAKDLAVLAALGASGGFLWRRLVTRPARITYSAEGIAILLLIAGLMVTELAYDGARRVAEGAAPSWLAPAGSLAAMALGPLPRAGSSLAVLAGAALLLHLALILVFLNLLPQGKHFHVLTALPDVFFARLAPAALVPLDLEALESGDARFGTATVKDLSWKEGLDVLSCTECGRCQTHCPTHVTGKPLSHKEVNRALRRHLWAQAPALLELARAADPVAREAAAAKLPAITTVVEPDTAWACTTCGWCETACPVLLENVPRLVDIRRQQVQVEASFPEEAQRVFKGLEGQGNPWGIGSNRRTEWCADLDLPRAASGAPFEWLFFVGCAGAFDDRQKKVSRAVVALLRRAGVSFAILGDEETCTGDAARRLGNEYLFQAQARALVEVLERRGVKRILVQCPHCLNTLKNELPAFGGRYQVVHHAELLSRLATEGRLPAPMGPAVAGPVAFHDPCYLARWNGVTEPPRQALRHAGVELQELPRNRREGFCCGAGGGRFWLEERLGTRINQERVREAAEALGPGGGTIATGCPFCLTMLRDGVSETGREESLKVLDVAELLLAATEAPGRG